ncbi:MAG: WecB/TagA/CpsF family glycosyltransferase [Desulfobacterales bacterium]|nr:WecB/TagA/CpsF family glycosyltransferase [Desulfobacterales bacterium]MDD4392759.1 WecB/TagA/CpsF family glycosyltransferase [Desulfobacterales bacterium]
METAFERANILNIPFSCCQFSEILREIQKGINDRDSGCICITNTESLYHALRVPSHFQYIHNARFSCCDGIGVVIAGKLLGHSIPRLNGPDLMLKSCEYGTAKKWRHFFYGGKPGVADLLSRSLSSKYHGLITAGTYSPPFRELTSDEDDHVIELINDSRPDIVWVGLGLLKQEQWINKHMGKIHAPWMIGVGAAFDFYSDTVKRAPGVFRNLGMEWLYRLSFEPRMFKRNIYSFLVIWLVAKEIMRRR